MTTNYTYNIDSRELEQFMTKHSSELVLAWFCGIRVGTESVCGILHVTPRTLHNYISDGKLMVMNEGRKAHEFDLSDVLRFLLIKNKKIKQS